MAAVIVVSVLAVAAVIWLAWRQPWRAPGIRAAGLMLFYGYQSRHGAPAAEPAPEPAPIGDWPGEIVGVHICAECAAPLRDAGSACPRCGWTMPPGRAPWDRPAAMLLLPIESSDISGSGGPIRPPEPPAAGGGPGQAVTRTDGARTAPGAWRVVYETLAPADPADPPPLALGYMDGNRWAAHEPPPLGTDLGSFPAEPGQNGQVMVWRSGRWVWEWPPGGEPPPPEPELPPGGDWAPGTGPPRDDDWQPGPGAMHWQPSRLATPAERDTLTGNYRERTARHVRRNYRHGPMLAALITG